VHTAVAAAADEPPHSEAVLAAEVAASTRADVLHWAANWCRIAQVFPIWDRKLRRVRCGPRRLSLSH
jgi:hypothetical protein